MAQAGNSYVITLKQTHLDWGHHRYTNSRETIYGEGYIPIPSHEAHLFRVYNSNFSSTGLGYNEFNCVSSDGFFNGIFKATGCSKKGDEYAKNFNARGDLKGIGCWFSHCNAQVGDRVEVRWTSATNIEIRLIHSQQRSSI